MRKDDPSAALPRPALERPLPKILDSDEVGRLFEAAEARAASEEHLALRNLALLELLYGSGLRATELVSLPRGALRVGQPFLILKGKGIKERLVPISSRAEKAVVRWREEVPTVVALAVPERQVAPQPHAALSRSSGRWRPTPEFRPSGSARTSFATPSRRISCPAAQTFAWCSRCSAMPTLRRRKSTRMSTARG